MNISQLLEVLKNPQVSLSIGEKLLVGFSIALLSMSVVFIVLVVIAGIINLLQRENKVSENKVINNEIEIKNHKENDISTTSETEDMGALVGVITAAICAASGNSSNNIVVRKIVRSNNSKSSWESMRKSKV